MLAAESGGTAAAEISDPTGMCAGMSNRRMQREESPVAPWQRTAEGVQRGLALRQALRKMQSMCLTPPDAMYDRFTDRAKKVMSLAQDAATELHHDSIEVEHLFLGLLREGSGVAAAVLRELPIGLDGLLERIELPAGSAPATGRGELPFAAATGRALARAGEESTAIGHGFIGSEHLLLGLLAAGDGPARIIAEAGLELAAARQEIFEFCGGPRSYAIQRIVSGGQTGVDRGALDVAIEFGIEHGGWCPRGRRAEDGEIPARYSLRETPSAEYRVRTEKNVVDSDGTLILNRGEPSGGTALTIELCRERRRPYLVFDLDQPPHLVMGAAARWVLDNSIATLNVAGPRESNVPGIARQACHVLGHIINATSC